MGADGRGITVHADVRGLGSELSLVAVIEPCRGPV